MCSLYEIYWFILLRHKRLFDARIQVGIEGTLVRLTHHCTVMLSCEFVAWVNKSLLLPAVRQEKHRQSDSANVWMEELYDNIFTICSLCGAGTAWGLYGGRVHMGGMLGIFFIFFGMICKDVLDNWQHTVYITHQDFNILGENWHFTAI